MSKYESAKERLRIVFVRPLTVRHQKNKLGRRRRVQASTSLMIDGTSRYSLYSQSNPSKNLSVAVVVSVLEHSTRSHVEILGILGSYGTGQQS